MAALVSCRTTYVGADDELRLNAVPQMLDTCNKYHFGCFSWKYPLRPQASDGQRKSRSAGAGGWVVSVEVLGGAYGHHSSSAKTAGIGLMACRTKLAA